MNYMAALLLCFCGAGHTDIPDGTLLFVEGGNRYVREHTDSPFSHVAPIFNIDGVPYVYEAARPTLKKIKLDEYIRLINEENEKEKKQMKVWIMKPKPLSRNNARAMQRYCEKQMGREYSIKSYLTGEPQEGIHCGELTARAMVAGSMKVHGNLCRKTPQGIMNLARPYYHKLRML